MDITEFFNVIKLHPQISDIQKWGQSSSKNLQINGFCGSSCALFLQPCLKNRELPCIYILQDAEEAGYFYNDLIQISGDDDDAIFYFPSSYKKKIKEGLQKDPANQVLRTEALNAINQRKKWTLVTYPEAIAEKVISQHQLSKETLHLSLHEKTDIDFVIDVLTEYVRQALKRTITAKYAENRQLKVLTLDANIENRIMDSVKKVDNGSYLALDPDTMQNIIQVTRDEIDRVKDLIPHSIILTSPIVRSYYKKLVDQFLPNIVVLSFNEIDMNVQIQGVGGISWTQ